MVLHGHPAVAALKRSTYAVAIAVRSTGLHGQPAVAAWRPLRPMAVAAIRAAVLHGHRAVAALKLQFVGRPGEDAAGSPRSSGRGCIEAYSVAASSMRVVSRFSTVIRP